MKRQRNAGKMVSHDVDSRIPLRSIQATHWGCRGVGALSKCHSVLIPYVASQYQLRMGIISCELSCSVRTK
jgi:hypothetical protein